MAAEAAPAAVAPVNNFMHSLYNQINIFLNQKPVSPMNNACAYQVYIENLLNHGPAAKNSHLTNVLWYGDNPGEFDTLGNKNADFKARSACIKEDQIVDMIGHLPCDIFNQKRFLLNGVEVRLQLVRSRDLFCLLNGYGVQNHFNLNLITRVDMWNAIKVFSAEAEYTFQTKKMMSNQKI